MKNVIICSIILFVLWRSITLDAHKAKAKEKPTNNILFEKVQYRIHDRSVVSHDWLEFRPIAPNVYHFNATVILAKQLNESWTRGILNYKYNTYQRFLVDYKAEGCAILDSLFNGNSTDPFAQIVMDNFYEFFFDSGYDSNVQLKCPVPVGKWYVVSMLLFNGLLKFAPNFILFCLVAHKSECEPFFSAVAARWKIPSRFVRLHEPKCKALRQR